MLKSILLTLAFGFSIGVVSAQMWTPSPSIDTLNTMSFRDLLESNADAEYKWYAFLLQRGEMGMCAANEEVQVVENRHVCVAQPVEFMEIK